MKPSTLSSRPLSDAVILAGLSLTLSLHAGDVIKLNNTDNLNLGSSWTGGNPLGTGDVGVWDSTVTGANTTSLGAALSWSGIRIANPGGAIAINAGDSLTLGSAGIDMSAATQNLTLGHAVTLGTAQAWNVGSSRTLTLTGALDGSGALTKSGAGILTLSGANTATGAVAVTAGTLKGGAANALGSTTPVAGTSITTGATLDLGGFAQTTGSLSGGGIVTSTAVGGALTLGGDNATANFTGTLNSANIATVNKTGTGTQTLTGAGFWALTNTPQYNILDGTLTMDATGVANVANITPIGWAVSAGKTFNLSYNTPASTLLFKTGALSGAGTVNLSGAGCIDFWSSGTSSTLNGFTGQLNIGCSSLSIQTLNLAQATTTASVNVSPGKFLDLRSQGFGCDKLTGTGIVAASHPAGTAIKTLTVGTADGSSQFDGTIKDTDTSMIGYSAGGGIALTKTGTGTLTLTGPTTYSGATTINNGTLAVSNAAGWNSNVSFATTNSPKLQINTPLAADTWNFPKVISGANANATFEKTGPGSVTLTAAQTYTGATTVTAGALRLQSTEYTTAFPSIPGMKIWLDAADPEADGNTTTPTGGAAINTWKNKGTLGASGDFAAVQTGNAPTYTASVAAFNSKPTITFNAATGKQLANTTNFTNTVSVVYVGRIGATKARLVSGNTTNWILGYWGGNMNANYWGSANTGGPAADTNPHIWINGATGGSNILGYRFDAGGEAALPTGTGSTAPTAGLMLGGGWSGAEKSDGDIAELFVFDHQLTTAERVQLEGYLYNKYFGSQFAPIITSINSASPVAVAGGASFGGFGSAGNITVSGGGTLEGGNSGAGSLTANNVSLSGAATLKGSLSSTAGSRALTVANLAINGGDQSLLINPSGSGLTAGTYDLVVSTNPITAPGATSVQATLKSASRQYTPLVDGTGTKIQMIYDPTASVYWTGAAGSAWDSSATNWKVTSDNSDTQFRANDVVYFHDSPASSVVDISAADVNPVSTTFDNTSATAYTLQGSKGIATGTITKTNDGNVTIANPNNTSATIALNAGTVTLAQTGVLGTGNVSFGGGQLNFSGSTATWNRSLALNSPATIGVTDSGGTFTQSGVLSGNSSLTKSGAGILTLLGANTYIGGTTISGGTLQIGNGTANVATNGSYAISSGALYLNNATAAAPAWASFSGTGTLRLNSAQPVNGSANWGTPALPAGFTGTLQLDKGRVDAAPAALGGAANVSIGNGAQFLAFNNTTNSYSFPQNFSINGMGWGEGGLNFGALRVSTMNATFTGSITLTGDSGFLLQNAAGGVMTVSGDISGSHILSIYNDRGTAAAITLSGAKSYSGATTLSRGLLSVDSLANGGNPSSLGTSSSAAANLLLSTTGASTLRYTGGTAVTDRDFTLTAASSSTIDVSSTGTTLTLTGGSANTTGALTKSGTGTLALTGSNEHTGTTTVSAGTLLVNGSTHASSALSVSASATLGGTGAVGGTVTVNANGTLAPGLGGSIGTLDTGAVTLNGTYACQLDGATSDSLAANGSLSLSGATLAITTLSAPVAPSYVIATFTGATPSFTTVTGLPAGYVLDTATPGQIKLTLNPYSSWAASKGLTEANGGKTQNPDGDTFDNLMEFAFGTDPLAPSAGPITYADGAVTSPGAPTLSITNNGDTVDFRAVFGRRKDYLAAGLVYTVQFSADLIDWVDSTTTPTLVATGTEIDAVSVPYPFFIPTPRGMEKPPYFRVSVTEAP